MHHFHWDDFPHLKSVSEEITRNITLGSGALLITDFPHFFQSFPCTISTKLFHSRLPVKHSTGSQLLQTIRHLLTLFPAKEFELLLQLLLKASLTDSAKPETFTSAPEFAWKIWIRAGCPVASHRQTENIYQGVIWYHRDSVNRFLAKRTVLLVAPAPHRTRIGERFSQSKWTCSTRQCKTKGAVFKQNTEQHPTATWRALSGQKQIIAWTHTFFHINHMVTATVTVWEIFIPCSAQRQREFFAPSTS